MGRVLLSVVMYLTGGIIGGYLSSKLALSVSKGALRKIYGIAIILAGTYILLKSANAS
ncbi:hypothetical protein [Infirmifilum lucidum]|uniref:hypothetical protein n=1 Tax=Infirmifilum lucidum TaxID=2776706 RepID=UPI00384BA882